MSHDPDRYRSWRATMTLSAAGITLALCIFIAVLVGMALDRWLGTGYFTIIFAVLGVIAGFVEFFRAVNRALRALDADDERERRARRRPPDAEE